MISLKGWVIGKQSPATSIRVKYDNVLLSEAPINLSRPDVAKAYNLADGDNRGFKLDLNVIGIPPQTVLTLEVVLGDSGSVKIASLKTT